MNPEKLTSILIMIILLVATGCGPKVTAQARTSPKWTFENGEKFSAVAISKDGNYLGVGTFDTEMFYLFKGSLLLWKHHVGNVHSIDMSSDGRHIAVGVGGSFYLFSSEASTPRLEYQIGYESSMVATSSDGHNVAVGAMPGEYRQGAESELYMFEGDQPIPIWMATLEGVLESLSMSENGDYVVASTSLPGTLYVFAKEKGTPLWKHNFGDWSGGAQISADGGYIVAVGGDQGNISDLSRWPRVFQFSVQSSRSLYQKEVPELPPHQRLSVSSNGSIFALYYTGKSELMVFDKNVQPYGPGSIHNMSLSSRGLSLSMSSDGRYVFMGTLGGLLIHRYSSNSLSLWRQYATNNTSIYDVSSSSDGRYVAALGRQESPGNERFLLYLFNNFEEAETTNPWSQWSPLIVGTSIFVIGIAGFALYRKRRASSKAGEGRSASVPQRSPSPFDKSEERKMGE